MIYLSSPLLLTPSLEGFFTSCLPLRFLALHPHPPLVLLLAVIVGVVGVAVLLFSWLLLGSAIVCLKTNPPTPTPTQPNMETRQRLSTRKIYASERRKHLKKTRPFMYEMLLDYFS